MIRIKKWILDAKTVTFRSLNRLTSRSAFSNWGGYSKSHSDQKVKIILRRLFSVYRSYLLYRFPQEPYIDGYNYCRFEVVSGKEQLLDCANFEDADRYVPIYTEMIKNGDLVIFGYSNEDDRCIFRACVQLHDSIVSDGCFLKKIEMNEGYIHYVFCAPLARGHGVHTNAMKYISSLLNGYTLYSIVRTTNTPSLKGFYKAGFNIQERLIQYNIAGMRKLIRKEVKQ